MYNDNEPSILCTDECYFNFGAYPDSKRITADVLVIPRGAVMMHRLPQHGLGYYEGHPADAAPATQRPMSACCPVLVWCAEASWGGIETDIVPGTSPDTRSVPG